MPVRIMGESNNYFSTLDDLEFSQDHIKNFVEKEVPPENWYVFNCGKLRWTVQEEYGTVRTECTSFQRTEWFHELYSIFNVKINFGDVLFTRTPPPGIPPHIDRNRPVALNIPVTGKFNTSPIQWFEEFDKNSEVTRFYHSQVSPITGKPTALLFNPQKIHGVINEDDVDRCLLTIWWRDISYKKFLSGWNDGSIINWKVNEQNKFIKVRR
jgi:hypothetical protein